MRHSQIIDVTTGRECPVGEGGEIVKTRALVPGYFDDSDAFVLRDDGFYATRDYGWLSNDGWIFVTDRVKEDNFVHRGRRVRKIA